MPIKEEYIEELAFLEMEEIKSNLVDFLDDNYYLPYTLECRTKSIEKLKLKLMLHCNRGITGESLLDIPDMIGFRISVDTEDEVIRLKDLLKKFSNPKRLKDQFTYPRETGFKAFTYYYDCFGFKTEIQIMTKNMRDWTNQSHREHDLRKYGNLVRKKIL